MIQVATIEQANARWIFRSMQAYMEGEDRCTFNWIRGVIRSDVQLAKQLLSARFSGFRGSPRFRQIAEWLDAENLKAVASGSTGNKSEVTRRCP